MPFGKEGGRAQPMPCRCFIARNEQGATKTMVVHSSV